MLLHLIRVILRRERESLHYFRYRKSEVIYYRENESKSFTVFLGSEGPFYLDVGSTEKQVQSCQLVKVSLETKTGGSLLLSVPHICEPLSNSAVDLEKYFAFENSELADELEYTGPKEPQILIGSDQYWNLLL